MMFIFHYSLIHWYFNSVIAPIHENDDLRSNSLIHDSHCTKTSRSDGSISSHGEPSDQSLAVRSVDLPNIFDALFEKNEM